MNLWMAPIVAFISALTTAMTILVVTGALFFVIAPVIAMLASAPRGGVWVRIPLLWPLPGACAALALWSVLTNRVSSAGWETLAGVPFGIWVLLVVPIGGVHLLIRAARFASAPQKPTGKTERMFSRALYGWAAMVAGLSLLVAALISREPWLGAYAAAIMVAGFVIGWHEADAKMSVVSRGGTRILYVLVAPVFGLVSLSTLICTIFGIAMRIERGFTHGAVLLGILWFFTLVAFGAVMLVRPRFTTESSDE